MSVKDFPGHPSGSPFESDQFQRWLVALRNRQNIDLQQELTSVDSADELLIFDASETGPVKTKKVTVANVGTAVLAAGGSPTFNNLTVTGLLDISGAGAGQIKFPATQNASSNANTLDDYEEGTWTPGIAFGGGTTSITYSVQNGRYTKVGNIVICTFQINLSNKGSSTGNATVTGIPFTSNAGLPNMPYTVAFNNMAAGVTTAPTSQFGPSATTLLLRRFSAGALTTLTDADFNNTSVILGAGNYLT